MNMCCCPVCRNPIPSYEIERHVNKHFEDDEIGRDLELAHQIQNAPPSPPHLLDSDIPESSTSRDEPEDIDFQICYIISLQTKALFHRIEGGFINLLKTCLETEKNATSIVSGYVDHFQSIPKQDMGWGCGWRNIQMLSSHLLRERPEAREVMFGGSAFVPDIASLQRWLELAWHLGFDKPGSIYFKGKVYGSTKWIGTTECAAVFHSFGLRAKIVDFDNSAGKTSVGRVCGPMDKFVVRRNLNTHNSLPKPSDVSLHNNKQYHLLMKWVWNYFCQDSPKECGKQNVVVVTNKMPLYFQHQGHSRTIVGIQAKHQNNGPKTYNLLVLDPGHRTEALEKSLRENSGWQKFIKRGLHTLTNPQYQLCYVDPGIARGEEAEQLKTLQTVFLQS
ncbi:uncharacterized protein LOC141606910 [Silene latifolia]|uniref:uncharacterized protein LOC141606910 n=1 Tax=Silene latifolia TaxID=37657 RepID=UPI003D783959